MDKKVVLVGKFISDGADMVIGHHPHVIQGYEQYKKGIIFYSLGKVTKEELDRCSTCDMNAIANNGLR